VKDADGWIRALDLQPHPEGGFFRETYRSADAIDAGCLPARFPGTRPCSTAIYFLLRGDQRSALHRLRADEMWHFYAGGALTLHVIDRNGRLSVPVLGPDIERGESFQVVVKAGCWFGATVNDAASYTLAGCTVSPGFGLEDFELGDREALVRLYPDHAALIVRLAAR
jgi:hypothetical protein